jgi:hypothetical protein
LFPFWLTVTVEFVPVCSIVEVFGPAIAGAAAIASASADAEIYTRVFIALSFTA